MPEEIPPLSFALHHEINQFIQYVTVSRCGKVIEGLSRFISVVVSIYVCAPDAATLDNPIDYCADIFFLVCRSIQQVMHPLMMPILGLLLQSVNERQCYHALAQVIAGGLSDGGLVFSVV